MLMLVHNPVALRQQLTAGLLFAAMMFGCKHPAAVQEPSAPKNKMAEWRISHKEYFTVKEPCLSAPIEHTFVVNDAPFGHKLRIEMDSPRPLDMGYQVIVDGKEMRTSSFSTHQQDKTPAYVPGAERCEGLPGEPAPENIASAPGEASTKNNKAGKGGKSQPKEETPPKTVTKAAPEPVTAALNTYREYPNTNSGRHYYNISEMGFLKIIKSPEVRCYSQKGRVGEELDYTAGEIKPGATVTVRIYRTSGSRDMENVVFNVAFYDVVPKVPAKEYQAYLDARVEEDIAALKADESSCNAGFKDYDSSKQPIIAPLPPAPKKEVPSAAPGKGADWVPGSWRWTGKEYVWDGGFWRIPEKIEVAVKPPTPEVKPVISEAKPYTPPEVKPTKPYAAPTPAPEAYVALPVAPPPMKIETKTAPTAANVVWVPGYWAWSNGGYVWVAGRWETPPQIEMRWQPPRWDVSAKVLVPGKWVAPKK